MYKMVKISPENKDMGEKSNVENIYDLIDKEIKDKFKTNNPKKQQIRENKRHESESIFDEKFMYTIIIPIIKSCRVLTPKEIKFRFELEEMLPQHNVLDYRID